MNETHLERAMQIISNRRCTAQNDQQERIQEIEDRIPEIVEINRQLFRTSRELFQMIQNGVNVEKKVASLQQRNEQAQEMVQQLLVQNGYPTDYLKIHYTCEKCQDTGYSNNAYCSCLTNLCAKLATEELNKSVQFLTSDFSSFSLNYYQGIQTESGKSCYRAMESIYLYCKEYAHNFSLSSPSILFYGKTGLGKTHLSLAIANKVLQKGFHVLYDSVINFLRHVEKEHFGKDHNETDTLELLLSCDLLILDDLGTEFHSQFYQSTIYNIINTRMNRHKPIIISSNFDFNDISHLYEERITSRIFSTYTVHHFVGSDVRILKRKIGEKQN
ncbi:MAG: ATP-binding protein [Ruminococcus sp.]|nr:ATP-binding protein [Ruminococcus sp.]